MSCDFMQHVLPIYNITNDWVWFFILHKNKNIKPTKFIVFHRKWSWPSGVWDLVWNMQYISIHVVFEKIIMFSTLPIFQKLIHLTPPFGIETFIASVIRHHNLSLIFLNTMIYLKYACEPISNCLLYSASNSCSTVSTPLWFLWKFLRHLLTSRTCWSTVCYHSTNIWHYSFSQMRTSSYVCQE